MHLQNIYDTDELKTEATTEIFSVVRREGNRDVKTEVSITKNYLKEVELADMGQLVQIDTI